MKRTLSAAEALLLQPLLLLLLQPLLLLLPLLGDGRVTTSFTSTASTEPPLP
jgi:hypothetical protein